MSPILSRLFRPAALLLLVAPALADEPRLHVSWRAPYGMPRASDTLSAACGDSTRRDTLYLTYETGRHSRFFVGLEGSLYFRAEPGDSLAPFWQFDQQGANVMVDFSSDSIPGCVRPFGGSKNFAGSFFDRTTGSGRLRLVQVVPIAEPVPVRDSTYYFLARLVISRPIGRRGCEKPVCIEWATADLALDSTFVTKAGRAGRRFVSWNSGKGGVCGDFRPKGPAPWRPKPPTGGR